MIPLTWESKIVKLIEAENTVLVGGDKVLGEMGSCCFSMGIKFGQPGRNGQIIRKPQPSKTEPGRNRKYKQTNHKH